MESPKATEVKVEFLKSLARTQFALVYKEGGFLGRGKDARKFEFSMNPEEHLDNGMIVKDEKVL